jgi:hypothetical protein
MIDSDSMARLIMFRFTAMLEGMDKMISFAIRNRDEWASLLQEWWNVLEKSEHSQAQKAIFLNAPELLKAS